MKKEMTKKSLNLKKLKISKLNNLNGIHGGSGCTGAEDVLGTASHGPPNFLPCHSDACWY
jgi:hypothetical protein